MSTADQWETATVSVEDIEPGWQISFGGVWLAVGRASVRDVTTDVIIPGRGEVMMTTGTVVEVRRPVPPDPDAELVEIMAKAHWESSGSFWVNASVPNYMRDALTAARAAGYRIEREA